MFEPKADLQAVDFHETLSRVRFLSLTSVVLFLAGWIAWFAPFDDLLDRSGTPLGGDYPMFYLAGRMVIEGTTDRLYDQAEHQRKFHELFPGLSVNACLPYRYPPMVALLMVPLATLPYAASWAVFSGLSLLALSWVLWKLGSRVASRDHPLMPMVMMGFLCWPVTVETIFGGQASLFACAIALGVIGAIHHQRWLVAGLCCALAIYKPNVLALFGLGVILRFPRLVLPAAAGAAVMLLFTGVVLDWDTLQAYVQFAGDMAINSWDVETPFWKQHGLRNWVSLLAPGYERQILLVSGLTLAGAVAIIWRAIPRRVDHDRFAFATLLTINALFNPYLPIYDLALMGVAAALMIETFYERSSRQKTWCLWQTNLIFVALFFGPHLSQALATTIFVQPFSLVLFAILIWQLRVLASFIEWHGRLITCEARRAMSPS